MIRRVAESTAVPPTARRSRLRGSEALRDVFRETRLHPADLIQPLFVVERDEDAGPIEAMPGVARLSLARLGDEVERIRDSGVRSVLVFGVPGSKDATGAGAAQADGIVPRAVSRIKERAGTLAVMTDVCLCQYTDHGHCGVLRDGGIDLEPTLARLGEVGVAHAVAGADVVAPSAMLDGMVAAIRGALDAHGLTETAILSYAVKHASAFYGPFREAASSAPSFGDRRSHQMDPANAREAVGEAMQDVAEGADAIMIKPGLACLDLVRRVREADIGRPVLAYQVSGEYSMVLAGAERGWIDERGVALESLTALKRAGADAIVTYWATRAAAWIGGA